MTKSDKLIDRLLRKPKDFSFSELASVLKNLGYIEMKAGKTSGSRRAFIRQESRHIIRLHRPHAKHILKMYQIEYIINELKKEKLI
jgi:hypothetical protein